MKRAALILVPVLLAALLAGWIALRAPWKVRYQGRPLSDLLAREEPQDVSKAVASLGQLEVREGDFVVVEGIFSRLRQVGRTVVYNEIKALSVKPLNRLDPDFVG